MSDTDFLEAGVEPETPRMRAVVGSLEQVITQLVHSAEDCPSDRTLALLSIAISAKRIADSLDYICDHGINPK